MSMKISFNAGNSGYTSININSKRGEEAYMKNVMRNSDSDGNFLNAYGVVGMDATGKSLSEIPL
ncbi:MAG: hypothetical protein HDR23_03255 [Lachnospiraceae bacterium]|nr:hypothetical protein [Lachnospiraceae bacterium]MBD5455489.1 hypothetical protein [Lachnospiraceae bacterium]